MPIENVKDAETAIRFIRDAVAVSLQTAQRLEEVGDIALEGETGLEFLDDFGGVIDDLNDVLKWMETHVSYEE